MYDLLIRNGKIVDGSGNPWFRGDIGISNGKIVKIGKLSAGAAQIIDASDLVVCPGFVDLHSHGDIANLAEPTLDAKIMQGITTEIVGNCGLGPTPLTAETRESFKSLVAGSMGYPELQWNWNSFEEYMVAVDEVKSTTRTASYVPHGAIRASVLGFENRQPSKSELEKMQSLVAEAMEAGAVGLSTGIQYVPSVFADTEELISLSKVVAKYGGIYCTHMRKGDLTAGIMEALVIGREAVLPVHISHLKIPGVLHLLEDARLQGIDVTFDLYPYSTVGGRLTGFLPGWVQEGGSECLLRRLRNPEVRKRLRAELVWELKNNELWRELDGVVVSGIGSKDNSWMCGRSMGEIASILGKDPFEAMFDLLVEEELQIGQYARVNLEEEKIVEAFCSPLAMAGSDGLYDDSLHPRLYGAFARILSRFVRQLSALPLEEAIRKMTSAPATRVGLRSIGFIREGFDADITVFDPDQITDVADFTHPKRTAVGVKYVMISGQIIISQGRPTGKLIGGALRRGF